MEIRRSCSPEVGWVRERGSRQEWIQTASGHGGVYRYHRRQEKAPATFGRKGQRTGKGGRAKPKASRTEQFYACRSFIPAGVQNLELQAGGEAVNLLDCFWKTLNVAASTKWELACRLARLWAVRAVFHLRLFGGYRLWVRRAYACRRRSLVDEQGRR